MIATIVFVTVILSVMILPRYLSFVKTKRKVARNPEHSDMIWALYYMAWRDPRATKLWSKANGTN